MWFLTLIRSLAVLNILQFLYVCARNPNEKCITVVQSGGDKSIHQLFCNREGECGPEFSNISEMEKRKLFKCAWYGFQR